MNILRKLFVWALVFVGLIGTSHAESFGHLGSMGRGFGHLGSAGKSGAAPALWTPLNLGASLVAWWDASDTAHIGLSGSNVTSWTDKVGGIIASQATSGNQPTWSATVRNGKPGLTFNGTTSVLSAASGLIGALPQGTTASSIVCQAFLNENAPSTQRSVALYGASGTDTVRAIIAQSGGQIARGDVAGAGINSATSLSQIDASVIFEVAAGATPAVSIIVNGGTATAGSLPTLATGTGSGLNIGAYTANLFWLGIIQQYFIVNRTLTSSEEAKIAGFLSWNTGQAGANLPGGHPYKSRAPFVSDP